MLIKNGSFYLRVHPCRLQLIDKKPQNNQPIQQIHCTNHPQPPPLHADQQQPYFSDSDSSDDLFNLHCNQRQMPATVASSQPSITPLQSSLSAHQATTASSQSSIAPSQSLTSTQTSTTTTQPIIIPDTSQQTKKIKPNSLIKYKLSSSSDWETAKILNHAGKATGKYSNCSNISDEYGEQKSIDLSKVKQWKVTKESEVTSRNEDDLLKRLSNLSLNEINDDETQIHDTLIANNKSQQTEARLKELEQWKREEVYDEVTDVGQNCISLRWVMKEKVYNNEKYIRAWLCPRGFEEEQNFRTDSPTCSREGLKLACSLIASSYWTVNSLDVKTAFLQGKTIERSVIVRPPKEANTNKLWKPKKCIYGLADACRYWYLKFREELIKLGATPSKLDQGIFIWSIDNKIIGIMISFVDDVLWGGSSEITSIIAKLRKTFYIGKENTQAFTYIGINLKQSNDFTITIDQDSYINSINEIKIDDIHNRNSDDKLTAYEVTLLRGALGKINWIAGMSRPEISYHVCEISMS